MMIKNLLQTSEVILLLKTAYKKYCLFEEWLSEIYKKTKIIFSGITAIFQYNFLGRVIENKKEDNLKEILENSRFVKRLLKTYDDWRKRVTDYLNTSLTVKHVIGVKRELYVSPVRTGSVIVVIAILSNIFFYALFGNSMQKEIRLFGWIIRGMLLFVGLAGLFCEVSLKNLKSSSLFLKWINHNRQSDLEEK